MSKHISLRVLHSAALLRPPSGILAQMQWEQDAANELGLTWAVKMYCPVHSIKPNTVSQFDLEIDSEKIASSIQKLKAWLHLRENYHRWLLSQQDEVDIFILRYYVHDPFQLWFIKQCKKPVYFVHHTLEVPELALPRNFTAFVRSNLDKLLGRWTLPYAAGLIGVTNEIVQYEINRGGFNGKPTYIYPNGIYFEKLRLLDRRQEEVPELLFVANFAPWHGLDILLKEVGKSDSQFVLHLVGKIPDELSELTRDSRLKVHGPMTHDQIVVLSAQCWIGLSSFALKRKKMKQACPLKVREYLMLGLPVYGDYQDVFPDDSPFFKKGTEDLEIILKFATQSRILEKESVSLMVKEIIEKKNLLNGLYHSLRG